MRLCTPLVGGSVGLSHVDFQVQRKLLPTKKPHRMVRVYGSTVLFGVGFGRVRRVDVGVVRFAWAAWF
jgi:hypothetical protein